MIGLCPHCGFNLAADEPLERGPWRLEVASAYLSGDRVDLTPQEAGFLHTLAKANGRPVAAATIGARISSSESGYKIAGVIACRLRQKLSNPPFTTAFGAGYRWAA